ncbi:aldehyde dehydrogenase family protein [Pseudactinotalea terrae]|uniref:aldehyde dehydrogenase family protein n=1 Tax=Pseudactinotalea terrae TaxID=1743262 RepID=UPI0012E1B376|nr:aldehyde dehydrogenase family protein [Pseudactinotalea terrae]
MSATTTSTPMSEVLALQRAAFHRDGPPSAAVRRDRIDRFAHAVLDNTDAIVDAISSDFGFRGEVTTLVADIVAFTAEVEIQRAGLGRWMRPRAGGGRLAGAAMRLAGLRAQIVPTPLGVVGVMGMWNFPLTLTAVPALTALAAGNRVMIKMSERVPRTAEVLANAWHDAFDVEEVAVVTGGLEVSQEFAALDLDHLFFTGSADVGSKIMAAAASRLTPVTLELGGKNPVIISEPAAARRESMRSAAARVAAARIQNGGQACINPDEVYVPSSAARLFVQDVFSAWGETVPDIIESGQMTTLIDDAAFDRVVGLLEDAAAKGAQVIRSVSSDAAGEDAMRRERVMPPVVVLGVTDEMRIDHEEVFGPVLAVHTYDDVAEVFDRLAARPAPLVASWFGPDDEDFRAFVARTRSGGVARNDWALSSFTPGLPFGGVGRSGMGSYHGRAGFDRFTHQRSVVGSNLPVSITQFTGPLVDARVQDALRAGVDAYRRLLRTRLRG